MEGGFGLAAGLLVVGFPVLLLAVLLLLQRLEAWMLEPDERAAEVTRLLELLDEADEVEQAVVQVLAPVAERGRGASRRARRQERRTG